MAFMASLTGPMERNKDQYSIFPKIDWIINNQHTLTANWNHMRWNSLNGVQTAGVVNRADSLMPITSIRVTTATIIIAGRLKMAVTCGRVAGSVPRAFIWSARPGLREVQPALTLSAAAKAAGRSMRCVWRAAESSGGT